MIETPDGELGYLGRYLKAWANGQRFSPTQTSMAKELGISGQNLSNWMRASYRHPLYPNQLQKIARMVAKDTDKPVDVIYDEALEAVLKDTGHIPTRRWRDDAASTRKAR